jgi:hypothetical protein
MASWTEKHCQTRVAMTRCRSTCPDSGSKQRLREGSPSIGARLLLRQDKTQHIYPDLVGHEMPLPEAKQPLLRLPQDLHHGTCIYLRAAFQAPHIYV